MAEDPTESAPEGDEGKGETPDPAPTPTPKPAKPADSGEPEIPPALKAVIDKERRLARDAEKRAKSFESELSKLRETTMTEHERAVKAAREAGLSEGVEKGNARLVRAEVIAAAAGRVADPEDAYVLLKAAGALDELTVSDSGELDTGAIKQALDDLVKAKPHLAQRRGPQPGARTPANFAPDSIDSQFDAWIRQATRK